MQQTRSSCRVPAAPGWEGHGSADRPVDTRQHPPIHPTLRAAFRSQPTRRPTGAAPPLPYRLQTSGIGWLVAAAVLIGLTLAVFARGLRGPAITVTVVDDAVVSWLAGLLGSGLVTPCGAWRASAPGGCCTRCTPGCCWGCWSCGAGGTCSSGWSPCSLGPSSSRSWRPSHGGRGRWGRPAGELGRLGAAVNTGRLHDGDPHGGAVHAGARGALAQHRQVAGGRGGHAGRRDPDRVGHRSPHRRAGRRGYRGDDPAAAVRRFTPNEVYPVAYRRGRSAHLDIGGARGQAIRRALADQLGLVVQDIKPSGCRGRPAPPPCGSRSRATRPGSCSASCMPRATCVRTAGTSWAGSCCTAGWRTRSHSTACGGWSSRRTTRWR